MTQTSSNSYPKPQNPLILRAHRLMDAFAKSDDERDFFLDKVEGFIIYVDLDKTQDELDKLYDELKNHPIVIAFFLNLLSMKQKNHGRVCK